MMTTKPPSSADKQDKYKNSNRSKLFDRKLRFSGLLELKFQKRELIKENGEKHFTKPDRKFIFEHEENMICEVVNTWALKKAKSQASTGSENSMLLQREPDKC